jgi:hypothetical protein
MKYPIVLTKDIYTKAALVMTIIALLISMPNWSVTWFTLMFPFIPLTGLFGFICFSMAWTRRDKDKSRVWGFVVMTLVLAWVLTVITHIPIAEADGFIPLFKQWHPLVAAIRIMLFAVFFLLLLVVVVFKEKGEENAK